jgi:hypothetical protein
MDAGPREPVAKAPVFVDVSGRRRRGVSVLGYLGASACTAYLVAFGITLSTTAGTVPAAGVALDPGPVPGPDAEEIVGDTAALVPPPAAGARTADAATDADVTARSVSHQTSRTHATRGRHAAGGSPAAPDPVAAPARGTGVRALPVAVTAPTRAAPAQISPTPTAPTRPTPDTTPATGAPGGSSSGGAGPTTGTGSTGGGGTGTDVGTGTGGGPGDTVADPATSDVLAIGPAATTSGV